MIQLRYLLALAAIQFESALSFLHPQHEHAFISSSNNNNRRLMILSDSSSNSSTDKFTLGIALTREEGKNGKLINSIQNHATKKMLEGMIDIQLIEMPCIEHADGPDLAKFQRLATEEDPHFASYDYLVITSPESAKVFADTVKDSEKGSISAKIAVVGKATERALTDRGIKVDFVPSQANGETLAKELPITNTNTKILYPASVKASNTIEGQLSERTDGTFTVDRLNTYDTVSIKLNLDQLDRLMGDCQIACFGSPSAVDAWIENVDRALNIEHLEEDERRRTPGSQGNAVAVCIGTTTARRCLESGRWQANDIYYPVKNPGLDGWTDSCLTACGDVMERSFWSGDSDSW